MVGKNAMESCANLDLSFLPRRVPIDILVCALRCSIDILVRALRCSWGCRAQQACLRLSKLLGHSLCGKLLICEGS